MGVLKALVASCGSMEKGNTSENPQFRFAAWVLRAKAAGGIRSPHFWIITGLLALFGYIYYGVLTAYYDLYVILFFYPLIYAALVYRLRGVLVTGLVFLGILLPHALLLSHDTYALVRSLLFSLFAFLVSGLGATVLNYLESQWEAYQEILELNTRLHESLERLESTQKQLIHAEKMNAIGQLAASVAHEINNPLAGVLVYSKLLTRKLSGDAFDKAEAVSNLAKIEAAVENCSRVISSLLDFSRQTEPVLKPVEVGKVIDQVLFLTGHQAQMKKVKVVREDAKELPLVKADSGQLQQVFVNLVVNAIQAMSEGGTLTVRSSLADDGRISVSVQDTGTGIAPENMEKLFTPFFSTKGVKGVGLGLAVSYGIVERHGGSIEVKSKPGQGSTFTVFLPVYKVNRC